MYSSSIWFHNYWFCSKVPDLFFLLHRFLMLGTFCETTSHIKSQNSTQETSENVWISNSHWFIISDLNETKILAVPIHRWKSTSSLTGNFDQTNLQGSSVFVFGSWLRFDQFMYRRLLIQRYLTVCPFWSLNKPTLSTKPQPAKTNPPECLSVEIEVPSHHKHLLFGNLSILFGSEEWFFSSSFWLESIISFKFLKCTGTENQHETPILTC